MIVTYGTIVGVGGQVGFTDYELNSVQTALDLASLGERALSFDEWADEQEFMLTDHGYSLSELTAASCARLGARIAAVLRQDDEDDFLDALSALLESVDCRPRLTRHDGQPHLHYTPDGAPLGRWLPALAASGLALYACRHGRRRLKRCAATGCGRWFADTSKNRSRRYCSGACASRTTVAAFRSRSRGA